MPRGTKNLKTTDAGVSQKVSETSNWASIDTSKAKEEAAANNWAVLNLNALQPALPQPGWHTAKITQTSIASRTDALWLAITCQLDDGYMPPSMVQPLAAKADSPHARRVPDGLRLMFSTANAVGVELPAQLNPDALEELFEGKSIDIKLAQKARDGVNEMVIRKTAPAGTGGKQ